MNRKKIGLTLVILPLICLFVSGQANSALGIFLDTHNTHGTHGSLPGFVFPGASFSFLLAALFLAFSLGCLYFYLYKNVSAVFLRIHLILTAAACLCSLVLSVLCLIWLNGQSADSAALGYITRFL